MERDEIRELIKSYLKERLKIHVETSRNRNLFGDVSYGVTVMIGLGDGTEVETIAESSDSFTIKN